jgi:hypothetical protein
MRLPLIAACLALLSLGACADYQPAAAPAAPVVSAAPVKSADPVADITTIALADLNAAAADATAHNDVVAAQCYAGLVPVVQQVQALLPGALPKPIGVVTAFQTARDVKAGLAAQGGVLAKLRAQINQACAALWVDANVGIADPLSLFSGIPK